MSSHPIAILLCQGTPEWKRKNHEKTYCNCDRRWDSGIATAARLAKNGYEVTVREKYDTPDACCNQIVRDGHRFDIGPTLFLMPEVWEEIFVALGEKMKNYLDLQRINPTYKVHFDDGLRLELTSNIGDMQTQLEKVEKTAFTGFLRSGFSRKGVQYLCKIWSIKFHPHKPDPR